MSRRQTRRRLRPATPVAVMCERFEERALLTQLVPFADLTYRHPQLVGSSQEITILSAYSAEPNQVDVFVLDNATRVLSVPQRLHGSSSQVKVSQDGSTLLTTITRYEPGTGTYSGQEFHFYRHAVATGLFEETARYEILNDTYGYAESPQATEVDGAYVKVYGLSYDNSLLFLPSIQAAAPIVVIPPPSGYFYLTTTGGDVFAAGNSIGLNLLSPDGSSPIQIGGGYDSPVGVVNGKVLISRYTSTLRRLVSIDIASHTEVSLLVQPNGADFRLISAAGGPGGKTVLSVGGLSQFAIVTTDGTNDGTSVFPISLVDPPPLYDYGSTLVSGTSKVLASLSSADLWVWDLNEGSNQRLFDTNPFGNDRISSLISVGSEAWFTAQTEDSRFGVFRTDGTHTELEYSLPSDSAAQLIDAGGDVYLLDRYPSTGAIPGYGAALYKVDVSAPDLAEGPSQLRVQVTAAPETRQLNINWDAADASFYEVLVLPWVESGQSNNDAHFLNASSITYATSHSLYLSDSGYYGWHTVLVRGVKASGEATQWSTATLSLIDHPILPIEGQFFYQTDELRFGFKNPNYISRHLRIRRSSDAASEILFNELTDFRYEGETANSPFSEDDYYYYLVLPNLEDGDYLVEFLREYVDLNPVTQDLSLPLVSTFVPISIRNKTVIRNPEALNVAVQADGVHFSWNGSLQPADEGFEIWVSDFGRGLPRVINQTVRDHSLVHDLPNGIYRGWVGLKDLATGLTRWSPARNFVVANEAPRILNPGSQSTVARPVFQWTGSKSSKYEIWLSDLGTSQRIAFATVNGATQWTPKADLPAGRYAFWVRELVTNTAASPWSVRHVFTQQEPALKVIAGLNPGLDQTPVLEWESRPDAASYELWIAKVGVAGAVYHRTGIAGPVHRVATPLGNGDFTVWVRAYLGANKSTAWGAGYRMTVGAQVVLQVVGTTISWNAVPSATHYELWINYEGGEQARQAKIVYDATYVQTSFTLPPLPKGTYKAWVRAIRAEGGSLFAGSWSSAAELQITQAEAIEILDSELSAVLFVAVDRSQLPDHADMDKSVVEPTATQKDSPDRSAEASLDPARSHETIVVLTGRQIKAHQKVAITLRRDEPRSRTLPDNDPSAHHTSDQGASRGA